MAIFLVNSTSSITSDKKSLSGSKWRPFWKFWNTASIWPQIWKDRPKLCQKFFYGDDVINDITWWPQSFSLYSCLGEVGSGSKLQGQRLVNKCQCHNCLFLGYTCQKTISMNYIFEIAGQRSTSQAYWVTLALISNIANYLKYNYFLDCDGIDNVTLRLWKFSDFCSRHTVGVAGDDIMFHILVINAIDMDKTY